MSRRFSSAMPSRRTARLVAITLAVTAAGMLGGAAYAAPDQMLPLARSIGGSVSAGASLLAANAGQWLGSLASMASNMNMIDLLLGDRSPRRLAMLVVGALAFTLGGAAAFSAWRSRQQRRAGVTGRRSRIARKTPSRGVRLPSSAVLPIGVAPARRRGEGDMPRQVQALAAQGVGVADIARRTGLPLDAISLLLALAPQARQVTT